MKQWTEQDLILLYYGELGTSRTRELNNAIKNSDTLRRDYNALCELLDHELCDKVPAPSSDLNHNIMARVKAQHAQQVSTKGRGLPVMPSKLAWHWLRINRFGRVAATTAAVLVVVMITFYLGRFSVMPENHQITKSQPATVFDQTDSQRMLIARVDSHIETGQRLFTLINNSNQESSIDIEARRQMVINLINFNRLYRRLAEKSGDARLAEVLQQMESVLIEFDNSDGADSWKRVKQRLNDTDLLYKLKVTNSRLDREIT
jgi:hypothetical protein